MDIYTYAVKMDVYKGDTFVKTFDCPKFYMLDFIATFVFSGSPFKVVVTLPDGNTHSFGMDTVISSQLT